MTKDMTVGSIVAEDFNRAQTLEQMGIDYCCHGSDTLQTACEKKGLNADDVLAKLNGKEVVAGGAPDFANWPLDLLLFFFTVILMFVDVPSFLSLHHFFLAINS